VALLNGEAKLAVAAAKESMTGLRRMGDEVGALHVAEFLLRAQLVAGDLAGAMRLGPRIRDEAEQLQVKEVRIRSVILTGMALLARGKLEAATRCFREVPEQAFSPWTTALMWRFGQALAAVAGQRDEADRRAGQWVHAVHRLPENRQEMTLAALEQLDLPPQERCRVRTRSGVVTLGTERLAWLDPAEFDIMVDLLSKKVRVAGAELPLEKPATQPLLFALVAAFPETISIAEAGQVTQDKGADGKAATEEITVRIRELREQMRPLRYLKLNADKVNIGIEPTGRFAFIVPSAMTAGVLSAAQKKVLRLLRRYGTAQLTAIEEQCALVQPVARKELAALVKAGLVEAIRQGRGQAFRLA